MEKVKKFFWLFLTALGLFVIIFLIYSIVLINRYAREKQEIKKGYAEEDMTPTLSPPINGN